VQSSAVVQGSPPQMAAGLKRRPQAAFQSNDGFRGPVPRRACSAVGLAAEGLITARSARDPFSRGEGRRAPKHGESEAQVRPSTRNAGRVGMRESDARGCDRASEVSCRCRWAAAGFREVAVGTPREQRGAARVATDGNLARGNLERRESARFQEPRVKGRRGPGRRVNTRERARDRYRSTHARGASQGRWGKPQTPWEARGVTLSIRLTMEGTSGHRFRLIFTEGRRT